MPTFDPPESVRQWLQQEDYEALERAWLKAEQETCAEEVEDMDMELMDGYSSSTSPSSLARRKRAKRKKQPWNEGFHLLGKDSHGAPPATRRYFDSQPAELSPPKAPMRRGMVPPPDPNERTGAKAATSPQGRPRWNDQWSSLASRDNDAIHRHLRHYFDQRGMEASFRMRPHVDSEWLQRQPPRSSQRPSDEQLRLKHSVSAPSLGAGGAARGGGAASVAGADEEDPLDVSLRHQGSICWGTRCLRYGPSGDSPDGPKEKIPWVGDHHRCETEDNEMLNPVLRHYFDADGLESSFRNRGRHYGRPLPSVMGVGGGQKAAPSQSPKRSAVTSTASPGKNRRAPRTAAN